MSSCIRKIHAGDAKPTSGADVDGPASKVARIDLLDEGASDGAL